MVVARLHLNDRRIQVGIWLVGLGVVWVGYRANSTPLIVVGIVLASAGYWSRLGPTTRYRGRVVGVVNDWQRALGAARGEFVAAREQRRERFATAPVPASFADAHRRLLSLMAEPDGPPGASPAETGARGIASRVAAGHELGSLHAAAHSPEEHAYVEYATELLADLAEAHRHMTAEFERALSEAIARLEALRAPSRLAESQRTLAASLRSEFIGLTSYNNAVRDSDAAAAHAAVEQLSLERAVTQAAIADIYGTGG